MYSTLIISIFLSNFQFLTCNFLEAESNYLKPKLERNNIVNKGVWVRNKYKENLFEKSSLGNFIFRPSSLDADRLLQRNFDTFAENVMEETPFVSAYVERARRSTDQMRKQHSRKSMKSKKLKHSIEEVTSSKIPNLKPTSVFIDSPYEETILINNKKELLNVINDSTNNASINDKNAQENTTKMPDEVISFTEAMATEANLSLPKRSPQNYGIDNNERLDLVEDFNKTDENSNDRNAYEKDDKVWHQNAPIPDTNVYEVVPREKSKAVTERGLIKVISMLTKTFKKIIKQHNEVKKMYDKFNTINEHFVKQVDDINAKFNEFDSKYSDMIQFNDRLKAIEDKLISEEKFLKSKHKELDNNIIEFENQQKKFLAQQKQFYTIQKVMLSQNEKIHLKQSAIAKTQSDISHRQNNFARILKKTKQLFIDNRKVNYTNKENNDKIVNTTPIQTIIPTTTNTPSTVESIKLNLFSIPTKTKLSNQDDEIIKEKDDRPIDDLVYKYYFNNTFIDNLMKNKILNNYATNTNSIEIARNVKNKRDELETTILLPINNSKDNKIRVRRWINHFNKNKKSHKKDAQTLRTTPAFSNEGKKDPFLIMATSFCNEIGQNNNQQTLNWCVEKALRRLRFMDQKLFPQPVTVMKKHKPQILQKVSQDQRGKEKPGVTIIPFAPSTVWMATSLSLDPITTPLYAVPNQEVFFPDNDELESNLKQFDLTPDTEGNVYYDGSLHFSDIGPIAHESDGMSDIIPGIMNSKSQGDMNPIAIDLQSKRRAYVKRLNDNIVKTLRSRKL